MRKLLALTLLLALAAAACGTTATASPSGAAATPSAAASSAAPSAPASAEASASGSAESSASGSAEASGSGATGDATVMVADSDLGEILVDGEGMTLYMFVPDEETGESTCYDQCAENWPPLVAEGEITVGEGLDEADFSTVPRTDDAGDQVKVGDWPLYYFANDAAPGDTNGQGANEVWYVLGPDGEPIR
jgi:predicted lipoprotein with Yx(FWY)xxD motif